MPSATVTEKVQLPDEVARAMKSWRARGCWGTPPKDYILFHVILAGQALKTLKSDFTVHRDWVDGDGWYDGMKCVWAILEHRKTGKLVKIHWHDGNQEFFASHESGGSSPLRFRSF